MSTSRSNLLSAILFDFAFTAGTWADRWMSHVSTLALLTTSVAITWTHLLVLANVRSLALDTRWWWTFLFLLQAFPDVGTKLCSVKSLRRFHVINMLEQRLVVSFQYGQNMSAGVYKQPLSDVLDRQNVFINHVKFVETLCYDLVEIFREELSDTSHCLIKGEGRSIVGSEEACNFISLIFTELLL